MLQSRGCENARVLLAGLDVDGLSDTCGRWSSYGLSGSRRIALLTCSHCSRWARAAAGSTRRSS